MRLSHQNVASTLQEKGVSYGWKVACSPKQINLYKSVNKQVVSATIERNDDGKYILTPFVYQYRSKISYFDYSSEEERWSRNKLLFFSLVNLLKRCDTWDLIENKDSFLRINQNNPRIKNDETQKEITSHLKQLLSKNLASAHSLIHKKKNGK